MTLTFRKQCQCDASASGPRVLITNTPPDDKGVIVVRARLVAMACDACDTPWEIGAQ